MGALSDDELLWLVESSADTLEELSYYELPRATRAAIQAMSPSNTIPALGFGGLMDAIERAPKLVTLQLSAEVLTPDILQEILPKLDKLETLHVELSVIGLRGLARAPPSLTRLGVLAYGGEAQGDDDAERATFEGLEHLAVCPLGHVKHLIVPRHGHSGTKWDEVVERLAAIAQARSINLRLFG